MPYDINKEVLGKAGLDERKLVPMPRQVKRPLKAKKRKRMAFKARAYGG